MLKCGQSSRATSASAASSASSSTSCPSTLPRRSWRARAGFEQRHGERHRCGALAGSAPSGAPLQHSHPSVPTRAVLDVASAPLAPAIAAPAPRTAPPSSRPAVGECGFALDFSDHYTFCSSLAIGEGQYGVVYKAQHRATGQLVAVKVVNKDRTDRTRADHLQCIRSEVALWSQVQDCKFVVRLEGVYEDDQCVYLVQQLCTGGDLRTVLNSGRLNEKEAAQVLRSVIEVIHACHANRHVYGDCKPANFLLLHPHRTTGCQQFPQPKRKGDPSNPNNPSAPPNDGGVVPLNAPAPPPPAAATSSTSAPPGGLSNNVMPLPRRHTDTIREHLTASFMLPTVPGAASCSGLQFELPPSLTGALQQQQQQQQGRDSSAGGTSSSSQPVDGTGALPVAGERCDQLAANAAAAAPAPEDAASSSSTGGVGASGSLSPMQVLTSALPIESWVMQQQCLQSGEWSGGPDGQPSAAAAAAQVVMQHHVERCGTKCHEEMTVLATDFGCCQPLCHAPKGERGLTRGLTSGKRLGSPVYMAPEMWQAGALVNPGVDVWAAGVMLYQLISGRYPFWPLSPEQIDEGQLQLYQVVCGIQSNPICFQGEPWAHVSRQCKDLLRAMLERQPHMRISAKAVLRHPWMTAQLGYTPVLPYDTPEHEGKEEEHGTW